MVPGISSSDNRLDVGGNHPKTSISRSWGPRAQCTIRNCLSREHPLSCIVLATSCLPVPISPRIKIGHWRDEAFSTSLRISRICGVFPTTLTDALSGFILPLPLRSSIVGLEARFETLHRRSQLHFTQSHCEDSAQCLYERQPPAWENPSPSLQAIQEVRCIWQL